jgi:uncharacterized membrane protein
MRLLILLTFLLPFLLSIHASTNISPASPSIIIYYNGSVIINSYNQSIIYLPIPNVSVIHSTSAFILEGKKLVLSSKNTTVTYVGSIKGVISFSEPFNATIRVILPYTSSIKYLYPPPISATLNSSYLTLTFLTSNLTLIYVIASQQVVSPQTTSNTPSDSFFLVIILILLALSLAVTSFIAYLFIKNIRKEKEKILTEEEVEVSNANQLDERDKVVLSAIEKGADTLAKISKITGLPRTTAYRRVKRLINLGYVKEVREGNRIKYIVNKNENENR